MKQVINNIYRGLLKNRTSSEWRARYQTCTRLYILPCAGTGTLRL